MPDQDTYQIVRFYFGKPGKRRVIKRHLTLAEAQEHCNREDTHGGSTDDGTAWFDGHESESK